MQPVIVDAQGVVRFKANAVLAWLVKTKRIDLNEIHAQGFPAADLIHLDQLIGYSVSAFGGLEYVSPEVAAEADRAAELVR